MKFLKQCGVNIPDQVLSTVILFGLAFVSYRGFLSVWNNPPSATTCLVVLLAGVAFGIWISLPNKRLSEDAKTDL